MLDGRIICDKVAGAEVRVGVRCVVVRVEVEEAIVIVVVVITTDIQHFNVSVGVDAAKRRNPAHFAQVIPKSFQATS